MKNHTPISTQKEISDMVRHLKFVREELKIELAWFIAQAGSVKVRLYNGEKITWMFYHEAMKYLPYLDYTTYGDYHEKTSH